MASHTGDVVETGKMAIAQSKDRVRRGPGNKNLGPVRVAQPNPTGVVGSLAGKFLRGPDKGTG